MGSGERFDSISRILGGRMSRRQAMKVALGGAAGMAGATAMVAFQGGVAGAVCVPACGAGQQCCDTGVFGFGSFCAPTGTVCCGNSACQPATQQCCPGVPGLPPGPFCAPAGQICCGRQVCPAGGQVQCCQTGSEPHCELATYTCCGNIACPPGFVCQGYPAPSSCVPGP